MQMPLEEYDLSYYSKNLNALQDRFAIQLEFILFCLKERDIGDAHQAALWYTSFYSILCLLKV